MQMNVKPWETWNALEDNFKKNKDVKSKLIYGEYSKTIPSVSVMILTCKRSDKLERALKSALAQEYDKPYEIIVLDDCVYDQDTDDLMQEYCTRYKNIIYYRNERNLGQYANWNRACELCRTPWYCLLHNDDIMLPNYLNEMTSLENKDIGLIGTYFAVQDERLSSSRKCNSNEEKKRLLDRLINLFLKISGERLIELTIKDNIKHIFTFSCCLFINKDKAIEIGGLNDAFYPSSDFFFSSKMNYFYKTAFYTKKMSIRTIGDNVSLSQDVCNDSVICAYQHTFHMCKDLGYTDRRAKRKASIAAVCAEIGVKGYNDIDYGKVKSSLGISPIYNMRPVIALINIYSKFNWGKLLLRKRLLKRTNQ